MGFGNKPLLFAAAGAAAGFYGVGGMGAAAAGAVVGYFVGSSMGGRSPKKVAAVAPAAARQTADAARALQLVNELGKAHDPSGAGLQGGATTKPPPASTFTGHAEGHTRLDSLV